MRAVRFFAAISLVAGIVTVVACQEPTQVTIEVRLATAKCSEIHGTAINVGIKPSDTEEKVKSKFPNAQTTDCDEGAKRIGTLVITPSDEERGSVIVITSYGNRRDPTECQPPLYTDCIVARRQFTFTKHRRLSMPITIDPTCVNVPCDAFSTCRKGFCFKSDADACEGNEQCLEPGETAGGGTDPSTAVDGSSPDAFVDGSSGDDSGQTDSGDGAPGDGSFPDTGEGGDAPFPPPDAGGLSCDGNQRVICPPPSSACALTTFACCVSSSQPASIECVDTQPSAFSCPSSHANGRYCCSQADCGPNLTCPPGSPGVPRMCCTTTAVDAAAFSPFGVNPQCF